MKKLKSILIIAVIFCWSPIVSSAQIAPKKMYAIHQDIVKPSMVGDYEKILKELIGYLNQYNIQDVNFFVTQTADFRYSYVMPIDKMADLDKNMFSQLSEKLGKDKLDNLFTRMDKCYTAHGTYMITLEEDMCYMPEGISIAQDGLPYRVYYYYHATPENFQMLREKGLAVKNYYASKNSKIHYRVYKSGFGLIDSYYMVVVSAKDAESFAQMQKENVILIGDEGRKVLNDVLSYTSKYETFTGMMREDLAYHPKK